MCLAQSARVSFASRFMVCHDVAHSSFSSTAWHSGGMSAGGSRGSSHAQGAVRPCPRVELIRPASSCTMATLHPAFPLLKS